MALSDILEKINQATLKRLKDLEREFNEKKKKLEEYSEKDQKRIDQEMHAKVEEKKAKIIEKAENLAEREAKNELLRAKRQIIDEALAQALEELSQAENYTEVLTAMLKRTDLEEATIVPAQGKEDQTRKAIENSGKKYRLAEKGAPIKGGFILETEKIEIDNSFETIINEQLREDLEIKLNQLIFA